MLFVAVLCFSQDRGAIRENAPADIVVYDLDKLGILPSEVAEDLPGGEWRRGLLGRRPLKPTNLRLGPLLT